MSGPVRILVVDDDESIRDFTHTALADAGYDVVEAADGAAAPGPHWHLTAQRDPPGHAHAAYGSSRTRAVCSWRSPTPSWRCSPSGSQKSISSRHRSSPT